MKNFPSRLRSARLAAGKSQTALANELGWPPSALSHYEGGRRLPDLEHLRALAVALGVSADSLLDMGCRVSG